MSSKATDRIEEAVRIAEELIEADADFEAQKLEEARIFSSLLAAQAEQNGITAQ